MRQLAVLSLLTLATIAARSASAQVVVLDNLTLVDGTGAPPLANARILIDGDRLRAVGRAEAVPLPPGGAERIDLGGRFVLPGLVDAHFHIENDSRLALRQLSHGVTSFRDPGAWMEQFEELKRLIAADRLAGPRMSLCGPHIDGEHPAYPNDSVVARDPGEARLLAERVIREGATAVKVYFRLPLAGVKAVIEVCKARHVPVTAHLEIVDAREALRAGLDGIEHITSFGTCLVPERRAEQYRQAVLLDNGARRLGRYELLSEARFDGAGASELANVLRTTRPFVDPTLAVFEVRASTLPEGWNASFLTVGVKGFDNMKRLTLFAHRNGGRVVLGGHSTVPFAGRGEAPLRELELLVESGLTPLEAIQAATLNGARFLFREKDIGSIEAGKLADLIVVDGNPVQDISAMRRVERVMVGGRWIDVARYRTY